VRDSRGSIGDREIDAGVPGPASRPQISQWVRSYAPRRQGSRRHGSCPTRPSGCPEGVGSPPGATVASDDIKPRNGRAGTTPTRPEPVGDRDAEHPRVSVAPAGLSASPLRTGTLASRTCQPTHRWKSWQFDGVLSVFSRRVRRTMIHGRRPTECLTTTPVGLLSQRLNAPCGESWHHENRRVDTRGMGIAERDVRFPSRPSRHSRPDFP
jgi:hypothetical protein